MAIEVQDLQAQKLEIVCLAQQLMDKIDGEERDPTEAEEAELEGFTNRMDALDRQIERRQKLTAHQDALKTSAGTVAAKGKVGVSEVAAKGPTVFVKKDLGKCGFSNFGDYMIAVTRSSARAGTVDPRLIAMAPTSYSQEGNGPDGGFAVPPDFRQQIVEKVMGEDSLASRCDVWNTTSNQLVLPVDETTPWQTTGGVQAYWEGEGAQLTQSKLALQERTIRTVNLRALVNLTNELLEDAPSLEQYALKKVPEKMDYKINEAIFRGTGVGQPLGILSSPAKVTVAKESGQVADTIVFNNVEKMWSRMYAPCRRNAVWLANQDSEPTLASLGFPQPNGSTSSYPAYMPPGGLSVSPYGTLKGKPVIPLESASTVGSEGDLVFVDLSQYLLLVKGGAPRTDMSMHFLFDYDMMSLRIVFRIMGMPWWAAPITRAQGSNTLSCIVTLAERA